MQGEKQYIKLLTEIHQMDHHLLRILSSFIILQDADPQIRGTPKTWN